MKAAEKIQYILYYLYYYLLFIFIIYIYYLYYYFNYYYLDYFILMSGSHLSQMLMTAPPQRGASRKCGWCRVVEGAAAKKYNIFYLIIFILLFFDYLNRKTHPFQRCQWRSVTSAED